MCPNQNVHLTIFQIIQDSFLFPGSAEAAYHLYFDPKRLHSFFEGHKMLLRQNSRRHHYCYLFTIHNSLKSSADSNFCFTITDITAQQSVHRLRFFHISLDLRDRFKLIRSFFIREAFFKVTLPFGILSKSMTRDDLTLRI